MPTNPILAWHFVGSTLRDGRPIPPDGEVLRHPGLLSMCESGLHASRRIIDALNYAPGETICRVQCGGEILEGYDKLVCSERTILWRVGGHDLLRKFARQCALEVVHLWDAPRIVLEYLHTGDELKRAAAARTANAANAAAAIAANAAAAIAANAAAIAANAYAAYAAYAARDAQNDRLAKMVEQAHAGV